jgi:hypothetical protein
LREDPHREARRNSIIGTARRHHQRAGKPGIAKFKLRQPRVGHDSDRGFGFLPRWFRPCGLCGLCGPCGLRIWRDSIAQQVRCTYGMAACLGGRELAQRTKRDVRILAGGPGLQSPDSETSWHHLQVKNNVAEVFAETRGTCSKYMSLAGFPHHLFAHGSGTHPAPVSACPMIALIQAVIFGQRKTRNPPFRRASGIFECSSTCLDAVLVPEGGLEPPRF